MTLNKSELVQIREMTLDDKNFIFASWLRGLYYGDSWYSEIPKSIFMDVYHKIIEHILSKPDTLVLVACLREDPTVILGYSVFSRSTPALHWIFVKKAWRLIGIAKSLVVSNTTTVTHLTKVGLSITKRKGFIFNPFIV